MKSGRILFNRLFTLSSVAFAFLSISAKATETNIPDFYSESGASAKRNYAGTDTEVIDPFSGSLQLMYGDLEITGNGDAGAAIMRTYSPHRAAKGYGSGYEVGSESSTGVGWDIHLGRVWGRGNADQPSCQSNTVDVRNNPVLELPDGSMHVLANAPAGSNYDFISKDRWIGRCITSQHQENGVTYVDVGLIVTSPNGTQYTFDHLSQVHADVNEKPALHVTRIEDRNGNWVEIEYQPRDTHWLTEFKQITGSDGGKISFTYTDSGTATTRLTRISSSGRNWNYHYVAVPNVSEGYYFLDSVSGPEGLNWEYEYYGASSSDAYLVKSVTNPFGAKTEYTYQQVRFSSDVLVPSRAISTKTVTGPGLDRAVWQYDFDPNSSYDETVITSPQNKEIYRHYGQRSAGLGSVWKIGLPISKETQTLSGQTVRKESYDSWDKQFISSQNDFRPASSGIDEDIYAPILLKKTIEQDGSSYKTTYSNHTIFGAPQQIIEEGEDTRITNLTYRNLTDKWILSLQETESLEGVGTTSRTYDTRGNLESVTQFGIKTQELDYDSKGRVTSSADANGRVTHFSNYEKGIPKLETIDDGHGGTSTISRSVNSEGLITSVTDNGVTTEYSYDNLGRMTFIVFDGGDLKVRKLGDRYDYEIYIESHASTSINYSFSGRSRSTTRGGFQEVQRLDALGRMTSKTVSGDGYTITTSFEYDELGRLTYESYPDQLEGKKFKYDEIGRIESITEPGSRVTSNLYLSQNRVRTTDPKGNVTVQTFRSFGNPEEKQLVKIQQPEGVVTDITRNLLGQPLTITQDNITRAYNYDTRMQLVSESHPDQGHVNYVRDNVGNVLERRVQGNDIWQKFSYSIRNELEYRTTYSGETQIDYIRFKRGPNGFPASSVSAGGTQREYEYDRYGNLLQERYWVGDLPFEKPLIINYRYDELDNLESITYPSGRELHYAPNALGWPTQVSGVIDHIQYHSSGTPSEITYHNGVVTTLEQNPEQLAVSRLTVSNHQTLIDLDYDYDPNGNVESIQDYVNPEFSRSMNYDGLNRLTDVTGVWGIGSLTYDSTGNLLTKTLGANQYSYSYGSSTNRLEGISGPLTTKYEYNAKGQVTRKGNLQFSYSGDNMTKVRGALNLDYFYDESDQRAMEISDTDATYYLYSTHGQLLYETTVSGLKKEYYYLGNQQVGETVSVPPTITTAGDLTLISDTLRVEGFDIGAASAVDYYGKSVPVTNNYKGQLHLGTNYVTHFATDSWGDTGQAKQKISVQPGDALGGPVDNEVTGEGELIGTEDRDLIIATGSSTISGFAGDDLIIGSDFDDRIEADDAVGNDHISGGAGNDYIIYKEGNDVISGDEGNDSLLLYWSGYRWDDELGEMVYENPLDHSATVDGGSGNDVFILATAAQVISTDPEGDDRYEVYFVPQTASIADESGNDIYEFWPLHEIWDAYVQEGGLGSTIQTLAITDQSGDADRMNLGTYGHELSYIDVYFHRDNDDLIIGDFGTHAQIRIVGQFGDTPIELFEFNQEVHSHGSNFDSEDYNHTFFTDYTESEYQIPSLDPKILTASNIIDIFENMAYVVDHYTMGQSQRWYSRVPQIQSDGVLRDNSVLELDADFTPENTSVYLSTVEKGFVIKNANELDWLFISNNPGFSFTQYDSVRFADGTEWKPSEWTNVPSMDTSVINYTPIEPILLYVGETYEYRVPDGGISSPFTKNRKDFRWKFYNLPSWLTASDDFELSGTPTDADLGQSEAYINIESTLNSTVDQILKVLVLARSETMNFTSVPGAVATIENIYNYQPEVVGADESQTLTYSLFLAPETMVIDSETGAIEWVPGAENIGVHRVVMIVSDGHYSVVQDFKITVRADVAPEPEILPTLNVKVGTENAISVDPSFYLGDLSQFGDAPLNYSLKDAPEGISIDGNTGRIIGIPATSGNSSYVITVQVTDGLSLVVRTLEIEITQAAPAYLQSSGNPLVIEAEHYDVRGSVSGPYVWTPVTKDSYTGGAAIQVLPEDNVRYEFPEAANSARADYEVYFESAGTYYVWVRAKGPSTSSDSVHVGLDGVAYDSSVQLGAFFPTNTLVWSNTKNASTDRISLTVNSAGRHTFNLWMRESGTIIDKLVLTQDSSFVPEADGPVESPRQLDVTARVSAPDFQPLGGTYLPGTTVTLTSNTDGAEIYYTTDGSQPTAASTRYSDALVLDATTDLKAVALKPDYQNSPLVMVHYQIENALPIIQAMADQTVQIGETLTVAISAQDADSGYPLLAISNLPDGATFVDNADGTGTLEWHPKVADIGTHVLVVTATDTLGSAYQTSVNLTVRVLDSAVVAFKPDEAQGSLVVIEAEHTHGQNAQSPTHTWRLVNGSQYAGVKAMQAWPEDKVRYEYPEATGGARMDFDIRFSSPGTYYVWVRGLGPNTSSDSLHIGLDGVASESSIQVGNFFPIGSLVWSSTRNIVNDRITVSVTKAGVHRLNLWMRESGQIVDRIILTKDASFTPSGEGPAESAQEAGQ